MATAQPSTVIEGAAIGDIEDDLPPVAKSAEDRKAAAALSSLDAPRDDDSATGKNVDREAVRKAMGRLAEKNSGAGDAKQKEDGKKDAKKVVKVDPADVTLMVEELELSKPKATELLKAHDGDAIQAIRAFISAPS